MPMQFASIPTFVLLFVVLISLGFEWTQAGVVEQSSAMGIPDNIKGRSVHSFNYLCLFVCLFLQSVKLRKNCFQIWKNPHQIFFPKIRRNFRYFSHTLGKVDYMFSRFLIDFIFVLTLFSKSIHYNLLLLISFFAALLPTVIRNFYENMSEDEKKTLLEAVKNLDGNSGKQSEDQVTIGKSAQVIYSAI